MKVFLHKPKGMIEVPGKVSVEAKLYVTFRELSNAMGDIARLASECDKQKERIAELEAALIAIQKQVMDANEHETFDHFDMDTFYAALESVGLKGSWQYSTDAPNECEFQTDRAVALEAELEEVKDAKDVLEVAVSEKDKQIKDLEIGKRCLENDVGMQKDYFSLCGKLTVELKTEQDMRAIEGGEALGRERHYASRNLELVAALGEMEKLARRLLKYVKGYESEKAQVDAIMERVSDAP